MFLFSQLKAISGGEVIAQYADSEIRHIVTDSRKPILSEDAIFFAIRGPNHDGHAFIGNLFSRGLRQFVVESAETLSTRVIQNSNILRVPDSIRALQALATAHRMRFDHEIVAVTGSNGKTIVKEWLSTILAPHFRLAKTPKSYNSQIGVPLSVWQLEPWHQIGIFEAGISKPGEMKHLESIIRPRIGIFTNLGPAHDEGFGSRAEKLAEKWKLFERCEKVIYCCDQTYIETMPERLHNRGFSWGRSPGADISIRAQECRDQHTHLQLEYAGRHFFFTIPFADPASAENALHCIALCLFLEIDEENIQRGLNGLAPVSMRLALLKGINDCYIIDDSYSNDLAGLTTALDFQHQQAKSRKTVILSDIAQSGMNDPELYRKVNGILVNYGVDRLIGIGPGISGQKRQFKMKSLFYADTGSFLSAFEPSAFEKETVLIKGARAFGFERAVRKLMQRIHGTVLEIDLDALTHNLNFYRSRLKPGVRIMAMVKALAYGSGSNEVASLLEYHKVDYLAVAYAEEGIELRRNGIGLPIMVMNPSPESFEKIAEYGLEPEIYGPAQLREYLDFAGSRRQDAGIHIKIDTGMHRLGFTEEDIDALLALLGKNPNIRVLSVYTHLAGADEAKHNDFTRLQVKRFEAMSARISASCDTPPLRHVLNSAGIVRFPEYQYEMVRLGVGLYGFESSRSQPAALRPVSTLKTVVSQVRRVPAGETVGYGRRGFLQRDSSIATIALGYADGYFRAFGNGVGQVCIKDQLAPVVGNVCMDMTMIDVTGIPVEEGDEVVVFGEKPRVEDLAEAIGTIPYELLTNISERVKRVFFKE